MKYIIPFLLIFSSLISYERASSYPYLSGDTWRYFADWRLSKEESFDPKEVSLGDTIFVEYDCLKRFRKRYLPKIRNRFVLITPNCESGTDNPQPGRFETILESNKLGAWLVQNIDREATDKLVPIPIGLANQVWPHGQISILDPKVQRAPPKGNLRDHFVYVNFAVGTNREAREPCMEHFQTQICCQIAGERDFDEYLDDLSHTVFVASPPGNGQDCHRTWEALLMGCYPIVKSSTLNPLYENLPVVVVSNWEEVTEEFLQKKKEEFESKEWDTEKLYAPYWYQKVATIQKKIRDKPTFMEKVHAWFVKF